MRSTRRPLPFVFLAAVRATALPAAADQIAPFESGSWVGGAYADGNGRFAYCSAAHDGPRGAMLLVGMLRDYGWTIGLSNPAWQLRKRDSYPVRFRIDLGAWWDAIAYAVNPEQMAVPVPDGKALLDRFQRGVILEVEVAQETLTFSLDGSSELISDLAACAERQIQAENAGGGGANPAAPPPATQPARRVRVSGAASRTDREAAPRRNAPMGRASPMRSGIAPA
jgi:hypothetical protein